MPEPGPVQAAGEPGVARPAAGPWPASARFGPQGLLVGGMNAVELASRFLEVTANTVIIAAADNTAATMNSMGSRPVCQ